VCIDRQLTADAAYADVVLPATTMYEIDSYMVYGPIFRLREKMIEPVGEARNDYLIMAELAARLGYGDLYPQTEEDVIRFALEGSGHTLEDIREAGGWVQLPPRMMEYKKWQKGGLRKDGKPGFETPTGKYEIWSTTLEDYGYEPLPKYTEPKEGPLGNTVVAADFPLVFNSGARPHTDFRSQHHGIKELVKDSPEPIVEINSEDAGERGIEHGDLVEVRTLRAAVKFRARVTDDIVKGAVECNMGGGSPVGPKAWREWNVNELTDINNYDDISGFPVYKALLCDVVRVEKGTDAARHGAGPQEQQCGTGSREHQCGSGITIQQSAKPRPARSIYLDNNATTHLAGDVKDAMMPFLESQQGNPSSIHGEGRDAKQAIDDARRKIARLIGARPREITFTGGGSEADNLAIKGVALARRNAGRHIITTNIEHPAVLGACSFLERTGYRVTYLPVDRDGWLDPGTLADAITDDTILVSIMMANNEVGTILPIKELSGIAHERGVLFHTDGVQAVGKIAVDVKELDVDLLSISGHKFHAPKGTGALYAKKGVELEPLVHGGNQENGLRAGTENVAAIVGFGKAAELALHNGKHSDRLRALRDHLETEVRKLVPDAVLNGHPTKRLANTLNMTLPNHRGESLVVALDQRGIAISSGSACKSGSPAPTHVLLSMGRSEEEAHCAVRFSLSHLTTERDIEDIVFALDQVLEEMATTVRFLPCK
jgi:cysteine desulfurase NifS